MNDADIESISKTMDIMAQYELLLSDIYERCAAAWPDDKDFWLDIAHQEIQHAENIKMIKEIVKKAPSHFDLGRPLNPIAIATAIKGLQDIIQRLTAGDYSYEKILFIARDIENSILEAHYLDIVKTGNVEYQTLIKKIIHDTRNHSRQLQQKLTSVKART